MTAMSYVRSYNEIASIVSARPIRIPAHLRINALAIYNEGTLW